VRIAERGSDLRRGSVRQPYRGRKIGRECRDLLKVDITPPSIDPAIPPSSHSRPTLFDGVVVDTPLSAGSALCPPNDIPCVRPNLFRTERTPSSDKT
jgi:hypothetical protein